MNKTERCPACGQKLEGQAPDACPLCGFVLQRGRATGEDLTPYAQCRERGQRGWHPMCEWVWFAGSHRIKHLALMRASRASRRFATLNIGVLALALAFFEATLRGWRWVSRSAALDETFRPSGRGWLGVATMPAVGTSEWPLDAPASLWWNPAQAIIAWGVGLVLALLTSVIVLVMLRAGTTAAMDGKLRAERRMTAALHYGTAWALPMAAGFFLACLRPIAHVGAAASWFWYPPVQGIELAAGVMVALGAGLWWYWLLRLGATAPPSSRFRVTFFLAIVAPLLLVGTGMGWWWFMEWLYPILFASVGLAFG